MSNRQRNVTLSDSEIAYVIAHPEETIPSIAARLGISRAKLSMNMQLLGIGRDKGRAECQWENPDGTFNETEFGKLYSY